jgi:uncharacterized repeat protein (TIGR03847 family)
MPPVELDLRVTHLTADAIGQPGKRVFYIQGQSGTRTVTLIVEKVQIQSLALGVEQFLSSVAEKFPQLAAASADYVEERMRIPPPVDPLFRVGELGLGYDAENDLIVLVAREILAEDQDPAEGGVVRFWCSRSQIRAMAHWSAEVAARGRPLCPQCSEPIDPEGHFCPKKNGHLR